MRYLHNGGFHHCRIAAQHVCGRNFARCDVLALAKVAEWETAMTDPRMTDPRDYDYRRSDLERSNLDLSSASNALWGWIAGAVFVVVVLFLVFASGNKQEGAMNNLPSTSAPSTTGAAPRSSPPAVPVTPPATAPRQ